MHAEVRQSFQGIREFCGRERPALVAMGNITVLAIDAAERTAGEEDRAGAAGARNRRLLPQVRGRAGNEHLIAEAAKPGFYRAIRITATGT